MESEYVRMVENVEAVAALKVSVFVMPMAQAFLKPMIRAFVKQTIEESLRRMT